MSRLLQEEALRPDLSVEDKETLLRVLDGIEVRGDLYESEKQNYRIVRAQVRLQIEAVSKERRLTPAEVTTLSR